MFFIRYNNYGSDTYKKLDDFSYEKQDIINSDNFLQLSKNYPMLQYIKADILKFNSKITWRNESHEYKNKEIIIVGHSDFAVDDEMFNGYKHISKLWFCTNKNTDNPHIVNLPLGLTNDCDDSHIHRIYGNREVFFTILNHPKIIKNLAYMNFSISTYPQERQYVYNLFENKPYVTKGNSENTMEGRRKFLQEILCPRGNGIDTHRLWESLYMKTIPIVKYEILHEDYFDLPILFINDWSIIDEVFLNQKYDEIMSKYWNMDKLKMKYWNNLISKFVKIVS